MTKSVETLKLRLVVAKPIVCFAGADGMTEFVEEDWGFVVPYLDLGTMVENVIFLLDR